MKQVIVIVFASIMMAAASASAAGPDDILGVWYTEDKDAQIEIFKCGTMYCGKIVWLREPTYPEGSQEGTPGTPMLDNHNPDPELRKKPVIGLQMLFHFEYGGKNEWKSGKIYNVENGKRYSGKMTLASPYQLKIRGFIGISLIGSTTTWTR